MTPARDDDGPDPSALASGGSGQPCIALFWPPEGLVEGSGVATGIHVQCSGRWIVRTRASTYLVDLDRMVAARFPGPDLVDGLAASVLRRDRCDIPLEAVGAVVGDSMRLLLRLRGDGVLTVRETTAVTAIDRMPLASEMPPTDW